MDSQSTTLGKRLRELRSKRNLRQREVGAIIEVDGAFISKVENNEKPINRGHLKKLSVFFRIEEKELQTLWLADKIRMFLVKELYAKESITIVYNEFKILK